MAGNNNEKVLLQWEALETQRDPNALIWLVLSILAAIAVIIYSVYKQEWLMGAVFIVAIFAVAFTLLSKTKPIQIAITAKGIRVGPSFYDFEKIRGYWISPRKQTFNFQQKSRIGITVSFPLGRMRGENIKKYLPDYLVEMKEMETDLIDRLSKRLHF